MSDPAHVGEARDVPQRADEPATVISAQPTMITPPAPGAPGLGAPGAPGGLGAGVPTPSSPTAAGRPATAGAALPASGGPPTAAVPSEKAIAATVSADPSLTEDTLVEGIDDGTLYLMLRAFNKQVNHVLHPAVSLPPREPDLRHTDLQNVPYRSDTLKANLERLVRGLGPPASRGMREVARLTDWDHEFKRTAAYCAAYFIAWGFGVVVLAATMFFCVLICFPPTRRILFPYRPPTPDPDHPSRNRTADQERDEVPVEVSAVMTGFASALLFGTSDEGNATVGPKEFIDDWEDPAMEIHDEKGRLIGFRTTRYDRKAEIVEVNGKRVRVRRDRVDAQTEAEEKRDELVTWMAKSTETGLGKGADFIEIMQKALSPPPIYPDYYARFKIAGLLVVPALALHFVPARMFGRGATFIFGAVFWGHKWLERGARELIRRYPNWKMYVDPRNSILSGVPTDAQLVLHLLRVSEAEKDPLPAPPIYPTLEDTKDVIREKTGDNAGDIVGGEAAVGAPTSAEGAEPPPQGVKKVTATTKRKTKGAFKRIARKIAGMGSDVTVVGKEKKLRGKIDSLVLKAKWGDDAPGGYSAKLDGTSGHLFLDDEEGCLSWVPLLSKTPERVWYVDDLVEMKKDGVGAGRLALAAVSGAEIASLGLSLRFAKTADDVSLSEMSEEEQLAAAQRARETLVFKGVKEREALFNRLVAMGNQRWEML
ncbi:hypothetical protein CC85DRAFT_254875 [Cutaneotrichosporon oleaginosum]|uniref:Uncharacterized protein n=1 Tax=Cutaneotrichosporon oleaginosum TaxID=879819 RepID=A0A0J0XXF7_9TREE|nr:uncharacterized protein CC85DRAFT_254875 [Cutaneotrichosporon oleaginosum]KLT45723.1 hypothetical protein CC85DRAFT_254875 [Cutaneotrichosporon oleaginosum]TXT04508.1 hypothetical protein COLE_07327 [Cutaneotrichosporon oleaginosum]